MHLTLLTTANRFIPRDCRMDFIPNVPPSAIPLINQRDLLRSTNPNDPSLSDVNNIITSAISTHSRQTWIDKVQEAIKTSGTSTAAGPDNLAILHIRHLDNSGITYLTNTFNLSHATIPSIWKTAIIIAIPKPGKPPLLRSSYSPTSLLCPAVKVLERLLLPHLTAVIPLSDSQHGFCSLHSTTSAILHLSHTIAVGFKPHRPPLHTTIMAIDFSKAFDTVPALNSSPKSPLPLNHHHLSSSRPVLAGVLQGSVISPALVDLFVSDYPPPAPLITSYADDFTALATTIKIPDASIIFSAYSSDSRTNPYVTWEGTDLTHCRSFKILRITFDPHFIFTPHINTICERAQHRLNILKALAGSSWGQQTETITPTYKALIKSIVTYAAPIWFPNASLLSIAKLQTIQNAVLRIASGFLKMASASHLHRETGVLPVADHLSLFWSQYLLSSLRPHDPNYLTVTQPSGPRGMKHTFQSRFLPSIAHLLSPNGDCLPSTYRQSLNSLHSSAVQQAISAAGPNREQRRTPRVLPAALRTRPPATSSAAPTPPPTLPLWTSGWTRCPRQPSSLVSLHSQPISLLLSDPYPGLPRTPEHPDQLEQVLRQLFVLARCRVPKLRLFALQFTPTLIYLDLLALSQGDAKFSSSVELVLLALYNCEVLNEGGLFRLPSYRLPTLARPSVYHEPASLGPASFSTDSLVRYEHSEERLPPLPPVTLTLPGPAPSSGTRPGPLHNAAIREGSMSSNSNSSGGGTGINRKNSSCMTASSGQHLASLTAPTRPAVLSSVMASFNATITSLHRCVLLQLCKYTSRIVTHGLPRCGSHQQRSSYSDTTNSSSSGGGAAPNGATVPALPTPRLSLSADLLLQLVLAAYAAVHKLGDSTMAPAPAANGDASPTTATRNKRNSLPSLHHPHHHRHHKRSRSSGGSECVCVAIQAIEDIQLRCEADLLPDLLHLCYSVTHSLRHDNIINGEGSDTPPLVSVPPPPSTPLAKTCITNASFRTKKLPDDLLSLSEQTSYNPFTPEHYMLPEEMVIELPSKVPGPKKLGFQTASADAKKYMRGIKFGVGLDRPTGQVSPRITDGVDDTRVVQGSSVARVTFKSPLLRKLHVTRHKGAEKHTVAVDPEWHYEAARKLISDTKNCPLEFARDQNYGANCGRGPRGSVQMSRDIFSDNMTSASAPNTARSTPQMGLSSFKKKLSLTPGGETQPENIDVPSKVSPRSAAAMLAQHPVESDFISKGFPYKNLYELRKRDEASPFHNETLNRDFVASNFLYAGNDVSNTASDTDKSDTAGEGVTDDKGTNAFLYFKKQKRAVSENPTTSNIRSPKSQNVRVISTDFSEQFCSSRTEPRDIDHLIQDPSVYRNDCNDLEGDEKDGKGYFLKNFKPFTAIRHLSLRDKSKEPEEFGDICFSSPSSPRLVRDSSIKKSSSAKSKSSSNRASLNLPLDVCQVTMNDYMASSDESVVDPLDLVQDNMCQVEILRHHSVDESVVHGAGEERATVVGAASAVATGLAVGLASNENIDLCCKMAQVSGPGYTSDQAILRSNIDQSDPGLSAGLAASAPSSPCKRRCSAVSAANERPHSAVLLHSPHVPHQPQIWQV
ncbi:Reverse transcriptase domain [Trinorchestia longiramus]|nr:Reverse transcriptase domain [Trinorchestia longiramus]